jgi:hypothetical protein
VLFSHENALVHKFHVVQAVVYHADPVEFIHPAYYGDATLIDYYVFSHLKKFLRGKSFSSDDETIATVED